jgi:outer membrane protein OmpA-like peptidoglycan-associated protein
MKKLTKPLLLYGIIPLFLLTGCAYTQKVKDGGFAFERKQYALAVNLLEKEFRKADTRLEKGRIAYLLGASHLALYQPSRASEWFRNAYDNGYGPDALREYAATLKSTARYDEAIQAFKELGIEIGSPYEYRREINACQQAKDWLAEKQPVYSVELAAFNSRDADYAPQSYRNGTIAFTSDRPDATGDDEYAWTGASFADIFYTDPAVEGPVFLMEGAINSPDNEGTAVFSPDFRTAFFTRCQGDKRSDGICRILTATWDGEGWSAAVPVVPDMENVNHGQPALAADGKTIYFTADSPDGWGGYDIWSCTREGEGWSAPVLLSRTINTPGNEKFPAVDADTLYFSSDFHPGMGGLDIFRTWRLPSGGWTPAQNLKPPLNSAADDFAWMADHVSKRPAGVIQTGYFTSNREGGSGKDDIYRFQRMVPPPAPPRQDTAPLAYRLELDVFVLEKIYAEADNPGSKVLGRKQLDAATLQMQSDGFDWRTVRADADGVYRMVLAPAEDYLFRAAADGYLTDEKTFSTKGIGMDPEQPVQRFELELVLEKIFLDQEIVLEDIYYDFDRWEIRDDAKPTLNALSRALALNPDIRMQLSSHTDCRGNDRYNQELSQRRAQSAVDYLIAKGVSADRLEAKGFGESMPEATCSCSRCTEEEHQLNRRTAFTILSSDNEE